MLVIITSVVYMFYTTPVCNKMQMHIKVINKYMYGKEKFIINKFEITVVYYKHIRGMQIKNS